MQDLQAQAVIHGMRTAVGTGTSRSAAAAGSGETDLAPADLDEAERLFSKAAELFGLLATPIRLRIISALCQGEKNVSQLLQDIETTQPNMSQHLATLYRAGVLGKRRDSTQIYYRIANEQAASICRAVCTQVAMEMSADGASGRGR
jgi:ArsR family transcriptional regulator